MNNSTALARFGAIIRLLQASHHMSFDALAKATGIERAWLRGIADGFKVPGLFEAAAIDRAFGVAPGSVLAASMLDSDGIEALEESAPAPVAGRTADIERVRRFASPDPHLAKIPPGLEGWDYDCRSFRAVRRAACIARTRRLSVYDVVELGLYFLKVDTLPAWWRRSDPDRSSTSYPSRKSIGNYKRAAKTAGLKASDNFSHVQKMRRDRALKGKSASSLYGIQPAGEFCDAFGFPHPQS